MEDIGDDRHGPTFSVVVAFRIVARGAIFVALVGSEGSGLGFRLQLLGSDVSGLPGIDFTSQVFRACDGYVPGLRGFLGALLVVGIDSISRFQVLFGFEGSC